MSLEQRKDKQQACRYILSYLVEHPDAGDTLEGIVEWWLLNQKIRFETRIVSQAVAELVAQGLIVEQKGPDARTIYRAKRSKKKNKCNTRFVGPWWYLHTRFRTWVVSVVMGLIIGMVKERRHIWS